MNKETRERHDQLLEIARFGRDYPAVADMFRTMQRQMSAQHELLRGLHGRVHELETTLAQRENDGR